MARGSKVNNRTNAWDPILILLQIACLQCVYYITLGVLFGMVHVLLNTEISLEHVFTCRFLNISSATGCADVFVVLANAFPSAVVLCVIVERSKKCLDFALTSFFIHFIACLFYGGFPDTWNWWVVHTVSVVSTVMTGEYLCARQELRDIPLLQDIIRPRAPPSPRNSPRSSSKQDWV